MFIQIENTPNPATLKFIPDGNIVLESGTMEFKNQKQRFNNYNDYNVFIYIYVTCC